MLNAMSGFLRAWGKVPGALGISTHRTATFWLGTITLKPDGFIPAYGIERGASRCTLFLQAVRRSRSEKSASAKNS
jgi:hypothetical protein